MLAIAHTHMHARTYVLIRWYGIIVLPLMCYVVENNVHKHAHSSVRRKRIAAVL